MMNALNNPLVITLLIVVVFLIVALVAYTIIDVIWLRKSRIRRRIDGLTEGEAANETQESESTVSLDDPLPTLAGFLSSRGLVDKLFLMLLRAGVKLRPSEFIAVVSAIALLLGLITVFLVRNALVEIFAVGVGIAVPFLYLKILQARRLVMFNRQLPDTLALIGSAIRSGFSFPRAMQMVADEMPNPISEEFQRVINETSVGVPIDVALTRMVARVGSYDLELVVTAVIIQQQIGGNLAEIIDNIAETIRQRVRVEGEMSALTAEGRMSGVILVVLPFALVAVILAMNPSYLQPLLHEPVGVWLIAGGITLQIIGALVIKRMLVLDY